MIVQSISCLPETREKRYRRRFIRYSRPDQTCRGEQSVVIRWHRSTRYAKHFECPSVYSCSSGSCTQHLVHDRQLQLNNCHELHATDSFCDNVKIDSRPQIQSKANFNVMSRYAMAFYRVSQYVGGIAVFSNIHSVVAEISVCSSRVYIFELDCFRRWLRRDKYGRRISGFLVFGCLSPANACLTSPASK